MAGKIKSLVFAEGVEVTPTTDFDVIDSDSVQTMTNKNLSDSTTNIVDVSDATKKIAFDAGGTTGTKTTIAAAQTANRVVTLPDVTDTLVGKDESVTLTNKSLTSPNINTQATFKAGAEVRFNEATNTYYVGFKAGGISANKIWTLPLADGTLNQVLKTDGSGNLGWTSASAPSMDLYQVLIGSIGSVAQYVDTSATGRVQASINGFTATISVASPAVVTRTSHGLVTGDKVYFTTDGSLPGGVSANFGYYIHVINANTFHLANGLSNLLGGTYINTGSAGSGTHTCWYGGLGFSEFRQGALSGDDSPAGMVGETAKVQRAYADRVNITTATATTIPVTPSNLSLSAGHWRVSGSVGFLPAATTSVTSLAAAVSLVNNTFPAISTASNPSGNEYSTYREMPATVFGAKIQTLDIPAFDIKLSATTDIYLISFAAFTVSTLASWGSVWATRIK